MKPKHKRLLILLGGMVIATGVVIAVLSVLQQSLVFFYTPTDLVAKNPPSTTMVRLGGVAQPPVDSKTKQFLLTDTETTITITYQSALPSLFRYNQGAIVEGYWQGNNQFLAKTVLAKHDENYMPADVVDKLKEKGLWRGPEPTGDK